MHALVPMMTRDHWTLLKEQAGLAMRSQLLPAHIKNEAQAIIIAAKGAELGVPPLYALSNISVIGGKPTCTAELMLALIYRDQGNDAIKFTETSAERATILYKRRGWNRAEKHSFTMDDAHQAGLTGNQWTKYPGAMLRARCISAVARMAFPDSIAGLYTAEELGADLTLTEDGEEAPTAWRPSAGDGPDPELLAATARVEAVRADIRARFDVDTDPVPYDLTSEALALREQELRAYGNRLRAERREQKERAALLREIETLHARLLVHDPGAAERFCQPEDLPGLRAYVAQLRPLVAAQEAGAEQEEAQAVLP